MPLSPEEIVEGVASSATSTVYSCILWLHYYDYLTTSGSAFGDPDNFVGDMCEWSAIGPGGSRGQNRVFGRPQGTDMGSSKAVKALELQELVSLWKLLTEDESGYFKEIYVQDVQLTFCDFDKFKRGNVEGGWEGANRKLNETSEAGALVVGPVSLEEMARMAEKEFPNNRFIDL